MSIKSWGLGCWSVGSWVLGLFVFPATSPFGRPFWMSFLARDSNPKAENDLQLSGRVPGDPGAGDITWAYFIQEPIGEWSKPDLLKLLVLSSAPPLPCCTPFFAAPKNNRCSVLDPPSSGDSGHAGGAERVVHPGPRGRGGSSAAAEDLAVPKRRCPAGLWGGPPGLVGGREGRSGVVVVVCSLFFFFNREPEDLPGVLMAESDMERRSFKSASLSRWVFSSWFPPKGKDTPMLSAWMPFSELLNTPTRTPPPPTKPFTPPPPPATQPINPKTS